MGQLKSLAKNTAIYGVSSIIGKTLNWLLTPLFTYTLATTGEYGIITNLYAYVALFIVILTFGMETGFFRFANRKEEYDPKEVYSTTLISVGSVVLIFFILAIVFLQPLTLIVNSFSMETEVIIPDSFLLMMIFVLSLDAFSSIPFAYLRYTNRPVRFVALKMLFVILYILFCVFFLLVCPVIHKNFPEWISWFYRPDFSVGYILVSNLLATGIQTIFLLPQLTGFRYRVNKSLLRKMLQYSLPLLVLGIAGILNQTIDKLLFPFVYSDKEAAMDQLGIYGACFKIAVVMVMFTQAFRYAYEPLVFAKHKEKENKKAYSEAMKYFIIFGLFIFLGVTFYMDIIKYFINPTYHEGLLVVPIVMIGELFFGIYFNLSFWYKLTDQTYWGAVFSLIACVIIIFINIFFIPVYGYVACAWASCIGNGLIMLISFFIGQKKYPISYELKTIGLYALSAGSLFIVSLVVSIDNVILRLIFNTMLLSIYIFILIKRDLPLQEIPYVNRFFKKQ